MIHGNARPPRKGRSALGLGFRKDVMLRLYHAFLGLRNRPQPLTGKSGPRVTIKILTALLMGPCGSASSLRAAHRRVIALRAKISLWVGGRTCSTPTKEMQHGCR